MTTGLKNSASFKSEESNFARDLAQTVGPLLKLRATGKSRNQAEGLGCYQGHFYLGF